jgi:mRNA interferase MazF
MSLPRGTLVIVDLEATLGHGQRGTRPCLVVSDPAVNDSQRFPLLAVVPITGTPAPG